MVRAFLAAPGDGSPLVDPYVVIPRMDGGPPLVIEQADGFALAFFTQDASSTAFNAYDALSGKGVPNRITSADIVAINTTMRARSPHEAWTALTSWRGDLPWLAAIPVAFDLFRAGDTSWAAMRAHIEAAFASTVAPYRNLSVASKVLHLKRPRLFPVLDSLVLQQLGATTRPACAVLEHLRMVGRNNREALRVIHANLADAGIERSMVRILDALLWTSHPASSLAPELDGWEHILRWTDPTLDEAAD